MLQQKSKPEKDKNIVKGKEFVILTDVMKAIQVPIKDGNNKVINYESKEVCIKKNVKRKWYCRDINTISDLEQVFNNRGRIRKGFTQVYKSDGGFTVVKENYFKLKKELERLDIETEKKINYLPKGIKGFN